MERTYAVLPHEYLEEMDCLGDAEFGRLARALIKYSVTGELPALSGNERFFWKRVQACEDRFQSHFAESREKRAASGIKGASARWQKMAKDGNAITAMAKDGIAINEMASDGKNGYPIPTPTPTPTPKPKPRPNVLSSSNDDDKTARARANPVVAVYCEKISAIPSTSCISELVGFSEQLGAELCLRAIDIALDANARDWRYVKAILQRWQEAGFKTIADVDRSEAARQRKKGKAPDTVCDKNAWMDEFIHDDSPNTRRKNGGGGWDFCELARDCTNPQDLQS